jgi:hypothetical protein
LKKKDRKKITNQKKPRRTIRYINHLPTLLLSLLFLLTFPAFKISFLSLLLFPPASFSLFLSLFMVA